MTGLLSVALSSINIVSAGPNDTHAIYEYCYLIDSRYECFFYPYNWKTSWKWAQEFCSDHGGTLFGVIYKRAEVHASNKQQYAELLCDTIRATVCRFVCEYFFYTLR